MESTSSAPSYKEIQEEKRECGGEEDKDKGSCEVHAKMRVSSEVQHLNRSCGVCCFEMWIDVFQWHSVGFFNYEY